MMARVRYIFFTDSNEVCQRYSYNLDEGRNSIWLKTATYPECIGLRISNQSYINNEKVCNKPLNFLLQFSTEKAMVLNGLIYIFVHPNEDSIIAMRVEEHEMKKQLYKSQLLSNVTSLKTVIPFYS